jgi:predicted aldo/keto reductase-like oxidoreductase
MLWAVGKPELQIPVEVGNLRWRIGRSIMKANSSRRHFLERLVRSTAGLAAGLPLIEPSRAFAATGEMPYRTLGRTGEKVSLLGLGGYHLGLKTVAPEEAIRVIRTAIDNGVNFMDNCWEYNGGESEIRMGKGLLDGYRKKVFLMTKTDGLLKDVWNKQLDDSLRRLQTDMIDLVQFHEINLPTDPEVIFGPNGAIEAAMAAKKAGKIRYIGFTSHTDPAITLKMLDTAFAQKFTFDTVQMPLNVMDAHFRSFAKNVLPVLVKHKIGVLGMKSLGMSLIPKTSLVTARECLHYAMNLKTSVVINGCENPKDLDQGLEAARSFAPMGKSEVAALLAKTAAVAATGKCEPNKTMDYAIRRRARWQWYMGVPAPEPH